MEEPVQMEISESKEQEVRVSIVSSLSEFEEYKMGFKFQEYSYYSESHRSHQIEANKHEDQ